VFQQRWFSEWDDISSVGRALLVFQTAVIAPGVFVSSVIATFAWHTWFTMIIAAGAIAWLVGQRLSYRKLQTQRKRVA
jgi:chromate transport protein ChrA